MLSKFNDIMRSLVVYAENLEKNLHLTGGLVYSGRLLLALAEGCGSREEAYRLVQKNAMAAWSGKGRFIDLVKADSEVSRYLGPAEIEACFDLTHYLRNIDKIYRKCGV
jgi:adenylosuccinate lyase